MGHPRYSICNCHRTVCFRNRHHIVCTSQMPGSAAVKIDTFAYLPVQDFGNAYSTFIAQNYGAGKKDRIRKRTKESFLLSFIFCIIISAIVCIFAAPLMTIFVSAKETAVITCGVQYLLSNYIGEIGIWMAIPIGWVLADAVGLIHMKFHKI